jgi:hypothetical protein
VTDKDQLPPDEHPVKRKKASGYYDTPYGRFRSVTTIIEGGIPKPALVPWASRVVAACAIDHLPYLTKVRGRPAREAAYTWLRKAADRQRDDAGDLGSIVHRHAEARILGTPMPAPPEEAIPILAAFDRFLDDFKPSYEAAELIVCNPQDGWAGTCDAWLRFRGLGFVMNIIDYKTGKGVWAEAALQLGAYSRATCAWTRQGIEVEPPRAERAWVLHLRPSKYPVEEGGRGYGLIPIDLDDALYAQFLHAKALDAGAATRKAAVGDPVEPFHLPGLPDLPDPREQAS